ncbi:hypothetical protein F4782DRAFT_535756 [Xylaria castorea]|nr:hypothetical protein F4782DRAFT_535756 [Xylaria castorea]
MPRYVLHSSVQFEVDWVPTTIRKPPEYSTFVPALSICGVLAVLEQLGQHSHSDGRLAPHDCLHLTFQDFHTANPGSLTTTYTAISSISCGSVHLATDTEGFWLEQANSVEDCFPPNFTALDGYYYSPGICQDGYTYACTTNVGGSGTTAATCCPSGFTCRSTQSDDDNNACQSILRSDSPYIGDVITYQNGRSKELGTTTTLIEAGEIVYAIGVPVRRAATDAEWSITSTNLDITPT